MPKPPMYNDQQMKNITIILDDMFLFGKRKDLATIIEYCAHRIQDMDGKLSQQIAIDIEEKARAIIDLPGGE